MSDHVLAPNVTGLSTAKPALVAPSWIKLASWLVTFKPRRLFKTRHVSRDCCEECWAQAKVFSISHSTNPSENGYHLTSLVYRWVNSIRAGKMPTLSFLTYFPIFEVIFQLSVNFFLDR